MNVSEYTYLLNQPDAVLDKQTDVLEKIVQEFPYFQSARALYLKGLYNQNSFKYNYALKIAAAHTTDRSVLFDFITSDTFTAIEKNRVEQPVEIHDIKVADSEVVDDVPKLEVRENTVEQSIFASIKEAEPVVETEPIAEIETVDLPVETISDADFFPKELTTEAETLVEDSSVSEQAQQEASIETIETETETEVETETIETPIEQKLEIGKPLSFATTEKHSFAEWLQLSQIKPIVRDENPVPIEPTEQTAPETVTEISRTDQTSEVNFEKQKKNELINKFIEASPKIPQLKHDMPLPSTFYEPSKADNSMLMTETLARVYLEQKKYHKAIQAYEILILKYPEKSSFFADRILDIKNLQQNNT